MLVAFLAAQLAFAAPLPVTGGDAKGLYKAMKEFKEPKCEDTTCEVKMESGFCQFTQLPFDNNMTMCMIPGESLNSKQADAFYAAMSEARVPQNCVGMMCALTWKSVSCKKVGRWFPDYDCEIHTD